MQRYIQQLVEDIHQATWNIKPPHDLWDFANPYNEVELEDMSYIEKYLYGDEEKISTITGIESNKLPSPEKLTLEQKVLLATELEQLLQLFHFYLDFPQNFPHHLRYPFIRNSWDEKHVALSFGENHIEFCDYEENDCPFPGYCTTCKEIAEQMKFDEKNQSQNPTNISNDDIELPF